MEFFATASRGTEEALRAELGELGFAGVRLNSGGIPFMGEWEDGWRACLQSRIAQRIQVVVSRFPAGNAEALYAGVAAIDWSPYLTARQTLAVSAFCHSSEMTHSGFIALKVKDAIVDQVRERTGERPDVDREDPDVRVFVYLARNRATVYLDLSGEALFKRGYRQEAGEAPLKETLAAAMLQMSGWDRKSPLVDPMCGSGTIAIEAALWAGNIAPGLLRERFGFERWAGFDQEAADRMSQLRGQARRQAHRQIPRIVASDADAEVLEMAKRNARAAGVKIAFRQGRIQEMQADGKARLVVTNPPYNERLEADTAFFRELCAAFCRLHGWRVCVLAGTPELPRAMSHRSLSSHEVLNGSLECRVLVYEIP